MSKTFSRLLTSARRVGTSLAVYSLAFCAPLYAGDFELDWNVSSWPVGATGPLSFALSDQYGFEIDATISFSGILEPGPGGQTPYLDNIFGGNVQSLVVVSDASAGNGRVGDATVSATMSFSSGGIAFPVDALEVDALDIDPTDNNDRFDRCDFVTFTGDNGTPTLTALGASPTVRVGPGVGSGLTGPLAINEAQCIYNTGLSPSATSNNDDAGNVRAAYPNSTSSVTLAYDESIEDVRGFVSFQDPAARGIGLLANAQFEVPQSITLFRSASPTSVAIGEVVTYTYTITNNGGLPFNTGQDIVIEDSLLGTVSCPSIDTLVAPGGTVTCTADYTIQAEDVLAGFVDSSAVAGIGAINQPFVTRLQSDTETLSVADNPILQTVGPQTCTPTNIFEAPRTQLAGPGSASALTTSDVFLFDNVTTDTSGNPIDVVFQATAFSNATSVELTPSLEARLTDTLESHVLYKVRLVQDGSATTGNPLGVLIDQSLINGVIVQQTDIDSTGVGRNASDVAGFTTGNPTVTTFNTVALATFASGGTTFAMDPAKVGNPLDWIDEPNETNFDNYTTYEYETFSENIFVHGLIGTEGTTPRRGTGLLLCAIANVSADVIAADDNYVATPINSLAGGIAGEVMANDTINGVPALFPTATLDVITPATPASPGDPVPVLETSGVNAGSVVVPSGVPAGIYTIEYRLCDAVDPTDCDRALVTLVVYEGTGLDFGDAPISYLTASHVVPSIPVRYLGSTPPDTELVAQSDATGTADDLVGTDDEDGVVFPLLTQGFDVVVEVQVTGTGLLQAWIDFNGDGLFEETLGERIATDLADDGTGADLVAGDGIIEVLVSVPSDATTNQTLSRFRYSSEAGLTTTSLAADGEVEDHSLVIAAADFVDRGDAPASYGDPRHVVVPSIYLGAGLPDTETVTQHTQNADGDDLAGSDDEDAIASWPVLVAGSTVSVTVQTRETLSIQADLGIAVSEGITNLQVFIDFNQNGTFESTEQVATDYRDGGTGDTDGVFNNQITFDVNVPANIGNRGTFARVRWSTSSGVVSDPFDGLNADGEVEDYRVQLANPNGAFQCDDTFWMVATETSSNLPSLSALNITESGGTYSLTQELLPPSYTGNYLVTGWGFSEVDNYIYGVRQSPRTLMRIDASGAIQEMSDLSALSIESPDTSSDILPNGIMVYMSGTNFGRYQLLDISDPLAPVALGVIDLGTSANYGRDIAYNPRDGLLYFMDANRNIFAFDPSNGTPGSATLLSVGNVPLPSGVFSMDPSSAWFDSSGFLYMFDNQSRQVWAVEVGSQGNRPTSFSFVEVENQVADLTYQGNDGASCRAPGPIASTIFAEGTITGTLYQDANTNGSLDNGEPGVPAITVTLYDDKGTPADLSDDTLFATTESQQDGTYSFNFVPSNATYHIEVDAADTDTPASYAISTGNPLTGVVVTTGVETSDQNFGYSFDSASADLSLIKEAFDTAGAPLTAADAGTQIDFVLTVTNDGANNATGVKVLDLIPDGFTYVSDNAASLGSTYDSGTGIWEVGTLANGTSIALTIRVTMNETGLHTNKAEISASDQTDVDSDPSVGFLTDDFADGVADDDEASVTVALTGTGAILSGTVFIDNGANGGTAFDGLQDIDENGVARAIIQVFDSTGTLIDSPTIRADGVWTLTLPAGYVDALTVTVTPDPGYLVISETPSALPTAVNTAPRDGSLTFTPANGINYSDIDFGLLESAKLSEDQTAAISAGQVTTLLHEYVVSAPGTVSFEVNTISEAPANGFTPALFLDEDCDGNADTPINAPLTTDADTLVCLALRVSASSGVGPNASYVTELIATTTYGTTGVNETDVNTDRLTAEKGEGALTLSKTVRNISAGGDEGILNGGAPGDVLEYSIQVDNPTSSPAIELKIYDRTPPYTILSEPISSPVTLGEMNCLLAKPSNNVAGYIGYLRWDCTGEFQPGSTGNLTFRVSIAP